MRNLLFYVIMAVIYERIQKTKNLKTLLGYKTKQSQ